MDSIRSQKIRAIKKYKRNQFLKSLFFYCFTALACLFYSSAFWVPTITSSMEALLLVHVPKLSSVLFSIKFVFIVGNIIVVALIVGESKLFSSAFSDSASHDVNQLGYYEEYINTRQSLQRYSAPDNNNNNTINMYSSTSTSITNVERKTVRVISDDRVNKLDHYSHHPHHHKDVKSRVSDHEMVVKKVEVLKAGLLPTEELKKRADDFIARVNKRRVFEAKELLCDF